MIKEKSVVEQLKAALEQNKNLKAQVSALEAEIQDLRDLINQTYDAQNG